MFARLTAVFITLVAVTGAVADGDTCTTSSCTNVCCQTGALVSRGVVCCWATLICASPGRDWLAGNKLLGSLSRAAVCFQHVLPYLCE